MAVGCLSKRAQRVIWRIFDVGESPLTKRSTYEEIQSVVAAEVPSDDQDRDTLQVQAWFQESSYGYLLKEEFRAEVACLILDGIEFERTGVVSWALAAVSGPAIETEIRRRWSAGDIQTFFEGAVVELEKACDHDVVLDPTRWSDVEPDKAKDAHISKDAVMREGRLRTFDHLDRWVPSPVLYGVRPAVVNMLGLTLELCPERFLELVRRLDHPVLQYHLSWHWRVGSRPENAKDPLEWISPDACDAEIALAIWEILGDMNSLWPPPTQAEDVVLQTGHDFTSSVVQIANSQATTDRVKELVKRLGELDGERRTRWIGELLGYAHWALGGARGGCKPERVEILDGLGYDILRRDVGSRPFDVWRQDLRSGLQAGGARRPLRYEAALAWTMRKDDCNQAIGLAAGVLEEYMRCTNDEDTHLEMDWNDWIDREAVQCMGRALALSHRDSDICEWALARCQDLPLSVWDVGEGIQDFWDAERIANDSFLIAFMAVEATKDLGEATAPAVIQRLAKLYWEHCRFVDQYGWKERTNGVVTEIAARFVVHFATPNDDWILGQANCEGVGARALWGLLDQSEREHEGETSGFWDGRQDFSVEMLRIAKRRFVEEEPCDLSSLEFWGRFWLHLNAVDQAEETASEILRPRLQPLERGLEVLALRLLCLVTKARTVAENVRDSIVPLYTRLWPAHSSTREDEQKDRDEITRALVTAGLLSPSG